nr:ribonuclease H-like domain, reverse transcriptase, RNA-dependent DNA polymerase [Tanacetum cinerariifolium]
MNYIPVSAENQIDKNAGPQDTNGNAGTQDNVDAGKKVSDQHYIVLSLWSSISSTYKSSDDKPAYNKPKDDTGSKTIKELVNKEDQAYRHELDRLMNDSQIPDLEETVELQSTGIFNSAYDDDFDIYTSLAQSVGAEADFNNMESSTIVSPIPTHKDDIMLVQVYVDDIIFRSTKKSLSDEFEALMHKRFQMSSIGELTFFLGLQVKQSEEGIFISQDKYVAEILKKFDFSFVKTVNAPIETQKPLVKDGVAADVDVYLYRSMIGSLMYLTASRPDI